MATKYVPVVDMNQKLLMPTISSRARRWIKFGKATGFWKRGIFCVRLNVKPSGRKKQEIALGIDPGSKKEGFTLKSESHTYLNIQADAVTWVKEAIKVRRDMRKNRRWRNTPYRKQRLNRATNSFPPSTHARWGWKLRIANWLCKMFPISCFVVEDMKAETKKGQRGWNRSFSPLQTGKRWFYKELKKLGKLWLMQGYETAELRAKYGLKKSSNKMANKFSAHCVDSWVLANWLLGGHTKPDNEELLLITPLQFHRRQLHKLQPSEGGLRSRYGGTMSLGLKRGSLVKHEKLGLVYVGGFMSGRITLHSLETGKRLTRNVQISDCDFLAYNSWRGRFAF